MSKSDDCAIILIEKRIEIRGSWLWAKYVNHQKFNSGLSNIPIPIFECPPSNMYYFL